MDGFDVEVSDEMRANIGGFVDAFESAGWDCVDRRPLIDRKILIDPVAVARYSGPVFDMMCEFRMRDEYTSGVCIEFELLDRDQEVHYPHRLYALDQRQVVDAIIAVQDTLTADALSKLHATLAPLCDPLVLDTDEGLVTLSV
ncbi:hypothetical protein FKR81_12945 [Lentzea tibetensis]|uniref:Uncharacterized protein n=1 Tax=Lentzea tibetensis TaxID=2591470 RepID=A0A563EVQ0_9PSEU|nr:hypothetical protein [Lentzea tibetensis]TWP51766.1 hypothetical protein FKR81_12945 [Lentzea tibetensis]